MIRFFTLLTLFSALAACAPPPASQDSAELAALSDAWEAALNAGDVDSLVALYTEDALILPPNAKLASGQDAVRAEFRAMIDAGLRSNLERIDTRTAGDIGYSIGTFTMETADGTVVDRGKYTETWRLTDGEWRIASDMYSSDMPAEAASSQDHATMMVVHEVEDPARWLAAWQAEDGRRALFAEHGASHVHVYQNPDNPRLAGLVIGIKDADALQAFLTSPESEAAKAEDGVIDASLRMYTEIK